MSQINVATACLLATKDYIDFGYIYGTDHEPHRRVYLVSSQGVGKGVFRLVGSYS